MSALAQQQQMHHQPFMPIPPPAAQKQTTLFVGSISGGITDMFLNALLSVSCSDCLMIGHLVNCFSAGVWSDQVLQAAHHTCK
jgi:hypothetical protein